MGFSMKNDDDKYAVLRELLESGALSRKNFSEESLKLVYGGQTDATSRQPFKREPEGRRQGVDISAALTGIAIIQWFSVILGILGAIAGLLIATNKVDDPICLEIGDPNCIENFKYPDVAQGLALSFNAVFFAIVFFTLGAYMKARLQQGNLRN